MQHALELEFDLEKKVYNSFLTLTIQYHNNHSE
jgi:hypothetical protein